MLARALQRQGHEVQVVVTSRRRLNRPEYRYPDIRTPYPPWVHDLSRLLRWRWLLPGRGPVMQILNRCDFVFLSEEGPALAKGLRVPFAAMLTGSNLEVFAQRERLVSLLPSGLIPRSLRRLIAFLLIEPFLFSKQCAGISSATFVTYFARGLVPNGDRILDELGVGDDRRLFVLMADLELVRFSPPPLNARLRTFCATRLVWRPEKTTGLTTVDYKGSDIMLRGLADFSRRTGRTIDIHLVRKGPHVAATVALAAELGIQDQITWHNEMSQTEILKQFREADVVFEQLAESIVSMAGLDAMACGRPVIANWRPEVLDPILCEQAPVCQARTPGEVSAWLVRLDSDCSLRTELGRRGRAFVEKHFSADSAAAACLTRMISCVAQGT
jgi:glycosyltransferase involved in cell wall biosynthesis